MVRRRILMNTAKQASLSAYHHMWQQQQQQHQQLPHQQHPQALVVPSMPEYWHSVGNKMGGAMPRMAVMTPQEPSSRRLTRLRRHLMRPPREAVHLSPYMTNYVQHQQPPASYDSRYALRPGTIVSQYYGSQPAMPGAGARIAPKMVQSECGRPFKGGMNMFNPPPAKSPLPVQWQQQQHQLQQQHQQYHMLQQTRQAPVSILKNQMRAEAGQNLRSDFQTLATLKSKRMTSKTSSKYNEPIVEQIKTMPEPECPPKPKGRSKLVQPKTEPPCRPSQSTSSKIFNFGKCASSVLDKCSWTSESETSIYAAANSKIQNNPKSETPGYKSKRFSYEPEQLEEPTKKNPQPKETNDVVNTFSGIFLENLNRKQESGNEGSTVTLTNKVFQPKTANQSRSSLADKATNTRTGPLDELLQQISPKSGKLNINELLKSDKIKELDGSPMLQSLMELVAHLCESKEREKKKDEVKDDRLRAGLGAESGQKQYSVYLMVTSDEEEEEEVEHHDKGSSKMDVDQSNSEPKLKKDDRRVHGFEEYIQECSNDYQMKISSLRSRKRKRKRDSNYLHELSYPYPCPLPLLMRRPIHWPKADPVQTRTYSTQTRIHTRPRARSMFKTDPRTRNQRSINSAVGQNQSWRLWEDLPMTARVLKKAYSRMLHLSRTSSSSATK
ncbi:hypothetical protein KR009_006791 [Drosophila setifemur]|nr:hypothetical protein KR009_006791 [Drosophila setifemur]